MKRNIIIAIFVLLIPLMFGGCARLENYHTAETWAFCGVSPDDPYADAKLRTMSHSAGIDAIFGRCNPPDWSTYTPANPGARYMTPDEYKRLVPMAARYGMSVVVYDARVWSDDPAVRQEAIDYWMPVIDHVRAWDMGDEYDPASPEWQVLIDRWNIVRSHIEPVTGVGPFTNHLYWSLDQALLDLDGSEAHLSYDQYDVSASLDTASTFQWRTSHLMCAINALEHNGFVPTSKGMRQEMQLHLDAGCDSFLIFGGDVPFNTPGFDTPSLVTPTGKATPLAQAVLNGSRL